MKDSYTQFKGTSNQRGLSLIEILAVVAIISILGVVSTPLYQQYRLKTKVGIGITTMAPVQSLATEHFMLHGFWPADNAEAGAHAPDIYAKNFLTSVALTDSPAPGSIVLTYNSSILKRLGNDNTLIYYPDESNGYITWKCDKGTLMDRYRPKNCRA